ncbi:MAG: polysaccharide export protein [Verrucomicrobiales bacterium]|nr:polysaccharide export protein [Verrucomicrobiales bacterium]
MSKPNSPLLVLLLAVMLQAVSAMSQSSIDSATEHKQLRDEFKKAEQAAAKMEAENDAGTRDLDKLTRERQSLEADVIHYKGQVAYAQGQLEIAQKNNSADTQKWNHELISAKSKLENTEAQLQEVNGKIRGAIVTLQQSMGGSPQSNVIVPGDNLDVMVAEDPTLSRVYEVRSGGSVFIPQVGKVQVAGKDLAGAEAAIKEALGQNYIKDAHVAVERNDRAAGNSRILYLVGQFSRSGPWPIPAGFTPTVVTTILRSGGVTKTADLTRVRLLRLVGGQGVVEEVNVQAILDGVSLPSDLPLNAGDIIVIPAFANVVYVTGSVKKPGTMPILPDDELTAYTAVLRSGGFVRFANRAKIFVLRDRGNGEKQRIDVNIKRVNKGTSNDVILEPKDIIVVPERFFSF